jgi:HK97 family phage major capsid protein
MSLELKKLREELQTTWAEMKSRLETQDAEIKKLGGPTPETKASVDALNTKLDEVEKRIIAVETKANRPDGVQGDPEKGATEAKSAFFKWARNLPLTAEEAKLLRRPEAGEYKALSVGDATAAGYLAPAEYVREIIKGVVEFSPIRTIARVRPTSAKSIQIPRRTGTFAAQWVAEQGTRSETTGLTYGLEEIPTHELYALADVSTAMLEDSAFDLEAELRDEFAEQFGVAEGTALVSGSAVGRPEGFLTNAAVGFTVSGDADEITADGLVALYYDVKDVYARSGVWVLKRASLKKIRQLKEATTNAYIWQPGLQGGPPATILGQPYVEAIDMPAEAANAFPVAFGDFRRGYLIVDRIEIAVVRDPYTQANVGNIRFHARKRVGGQVVVAEAIRKLKCST